MDPREWLPQTELCVHLTPKEFLIWMMDIASNDRFAPVPLCNLGGMWEPISLLCSEPAHSPGLWALSLSLGAVF
jgi:hypothetical protein